MKRLAGRFGLWLSTRPLHRLPWFLFNLLFDLGLWLSRFLPDD